MKKKIVTMSLVGILILSLGAVSFADFGGYGNDTFYNSFKEKAQAKGFYKEYEDTMIEVHEEHFNELVEEGVITQEQAQEKLEAIKDGEVPLHNRMNRKGKRPFKGNKMKEGVEIFAELTDMSEETIIEYLRENQITLHEYAEAQGITEDFNTKMSELRKEHLEQLVEEGRITEEEAQEKIEAMENGEFPLNIKANRPSPRHKMPHGNNFRNNQ